ncbi:MAG: hypothetical protein O3C27_14410 [Actinomycetota bacterium]|nr:hypothetical protein [Actinomycetota bacterium]
MSNPRDGQEDEFNDWYEHTHLDEVLATTNFSSAQRFVLDEAKGAPSAHKYLALYETEADSVEAVVADLEARRDERQQSTSINRRDAALWVFSPTGDRHVVEGGQRK